MSQEQTKELQGQRRQGRQGTFKNIRRIKQKEHKMTVGKGKIDVSQDKQNNNKTEGLRAGMKKRIIIRERK